VATFIYRFQYFSKGVFIIDFFLTTGLLLGVRGSFRLFLETQKRKTLTGPKVFVYGAGRAGELLLREILNNKQLHVIPIGLIDDDALKKGKKIQGYSILGGFDDIERLIEKHHPDGILMSFNQSLTGNADRHRSVEAICRHHNLFLKRFQITLQSVELDSKNAA
jgi:UDP-GlcNAc:undecaprenyl-phosphate GlcNAc-1-phosphate transferase